MQRPDTPLQTFTLSIRHFAGIRVEENEVRLDDRLYDIENQTFTGDSVRLHVYRDRKEEALFEVLDHLFAPGRDLARSCPSPLQYWLAQWLCSAFLAPELFVVKAPREIATRAGFTFLMSAAQHVPGLNGPPPKRHLKKYVEDFLPEAKTRTFLVNFYLFEEA